MITDTKEYREMASIDPHNRRRKRSARWLGRFMLGLITVGVLVVVVGWFRGQG